MTVEADISPPSPQEWAARYREEGLWTGETVPQALREVARVHGDRAALVTDSGRFTHRELDEAAESFGAGLLAATPLRPGDRAMFQLGNVAETIVAYYGSLKAGIIPVCTLPQHGEREIGLLAEHTKARAHFVQADFRGRDLVASALRLRDTVSVLDTVVVTRGEAPQDAVSYESIVHAGQNAAARQELSAVEIDPAGLVVLQLSGGTTGLPKVAPRHHEEYLYNSRVWAETLGLHQGSVVLHALPIMHNAGIVAALQTAHVVGAACVVSPSADAETVLRLIESERVTALPVVPPAVAIRLLECENRGRARVATVERFVLGGQRPSIELLERLERELGIRALQMFGMAEGMFLHTPPDCSEWARLNTIGTPISAADEVRVLEVGGENEVPDGAVGELACRGPYTITGYYHADAHNATAFTSDGYYRTGDLVTRHIIDGHAYYSIDGRIKDVINRGAEKIHAEEIEELLARHPEVAGAAVVAMPDPVLGERICAYVVPAGNVRRPTLASLTDYLLGQGLAKFKLPERLELVGTLPLTNVGKVSKKDLRDDIADKIRKENEPS